MEGAGAALAAAVAAAGTASCRLHFSRETELRRWKSAGRKVVAAQFESEPQGISGPRAVTQSIRERRPPWARVASGTLSPDLELMDSAPGRSGLCCAPLLGALLGDSHHVSCMHMCLPLNTHVCPCTYLLTHVHTHACPCAHTCLSMLIHMPTFQTPRCKGM